jgi:hypothetical protein
VYEKYYFGLSYLDHKNEEDWLQMDKKVLKHEFQKKVDHLEFEFRLMFYPMDITQVLQYATLYQVSRRGLNCWWWWLFVWWLFCNKIHFLLTHSSIPSPHTPQAFLATKQDVVQGRLVMSGKDALLLAAMAFQAQRGDCNPAVHTPALLATEPFLPNKSMADFKVPPAVKAAALGCVVVDFCIFLFYFYSFSYSSSSFPSPSRFTHVGCVAVPIWQRKSSASG